MAGGAEMRQRIAELEIQVSGEAGQVGRGERCGLARGLDPVLTLARPAPSERGGPHPGPAEPLTPAAVHPLPAQGD